MSLIWRPELATGIEEIDEQHRVMIDKTNELLVAARSQLPRNQIAELIGSLRECAVVHFECEEGHMESRGCSACAANRFAHREFLRSFAGLEQQFEREGATASFVDQVREKVCAWLTTHVLAIDVALRETVDQGPEGRG